MTQRMLKLFSVFLALALFGAACGSDSVTSVAETATDTAEAVADTAAEAVADSTDAMEETIEEVANPAAADSCATDTIRIGAALSETGKYSVEGKDSRQGYNTWANWANANGGIDIGDGCSAQVEIIYYDDESDADTVKELTQKLISEDEVDFLLGPYSSGLTTQASAIAEQENILMVEGNGTSNAMFERGFDNLFLVATIASDYTKSGIEAFAAQGAKTAVLAYEDTSFPTAVANGAIEHLEANGIELLAVETYPKDPTNLTPIISKFKALDPDVFIGGGHYIDATLFLGAASDTGFDPDGMLITVGPSNPKLTNELGEDVFGVIGPTQWERTMAYSGEWIGSAEDFATLYEADHGEPPVYQSASAAASGLALQIAIEAAGATDTDSVRAALNSMDAVTFYGPIKFDGDGVNRGKPMGTVQVQNGDINVIAPALAATADFAYPMN